MATSTHSSQGVCVIEMKSAGENLVSAEKQALDYVDDLSDEEDVRYVIVQAPSRTSASSTCSRPTTSLPPQFTLDELPRTTTSSGSSPGTSNAFGSREPAGLGRPLASWRACTKSSSVRLPRSRREHLPRCASCSASTPATLAVWDERDLFQQFIETQTRRGLAPTWARSSRGCSNPQPGQAHVDRTAVAQFRTSTVACSVRPSRPLS